MDLQTSQIGTPHGKASCCWCSAALVVGQVEQLRCWLCPNCWARQEAQALYAIPKTRDQAKLFGVAVGTRVCENVPLPSQVLIYIQRARNLLWGGRAGPGKSHGVRRWLYGRALRILGYEGLLLRENWDQLDTTHLRKMEIEVPRLGGKFYRTDRKAVFGTGSSQGIIDCGHMAEVDAVHRYLSTEYVDIVPDEASLYPVDSQGISVLAELSTRARKQCTDREGQLVTGHFVPVTNPGGPSAQWLRDMFIHQTPDFEMFPQLTPVYDDDGRQTGGYRPEEWVYLSASLKDNPYMRDDYAETVLAVLSKVRYQQQAEGNWDVFPGAFFPEWTPSLHVQECVLQ